MMNSMDDIRTVGDVEKNSGQTPGWNRPKGNDKMLDGDQAGSKG